MLQDGVGRGDTAEYLTETHKLSESCILHFGDQVSILYKDTEPIGTLSKEDLLLQCYIRGPEIVSWKKSGFYRSGYLIYRWNEEYY